MENNSYVLILHGLGRTKKSMFKIQNYLTQKGYKTINKSYPSTGLSIENLTESFIKDIIKNNISEKTKVHFVTHSMGGILIRYFLKYNTIPNLGRVVMLAPPNNGSEVVDWLKGNPIYKRLLGPAGQQLSTKPDSIPLKLGSVDFELGVIAGNKSINLINSLIIKGPDDGKVSVDRTKAKGMKDFLVVNRTHPMIMNAPEVMFQTEYFLRKGFFKKL